MKFLVDVGVGRKVEQWLHKNGFNAKAVRDIDAIARDADILQLAASEGRMIITMDKDFGELVYNSGLPHSGVLILRLDDAKGQEKVEIVAGILSGFADEIEGRFCVYQDGRLRIR
jgi:predicted nuclease of predicted toxin-antitoxin system